MGWELKKYGLTLTFSGFFLDTFGGLLWLLIDCVFFLQSSAGLFTLACDAKQVSTWFEPMLNYHPLCISIPTHAAFHFPWNTFEFFPFFSLSSIAVFFIVAWESNLLALSCLSVFRISNWQPSLLDLLVSGVLIRQNPPQPRKISIPLRIVTIWYTIIGGLTWCDYFWRFLNALPESGNSLSDSGVALPIMLSTSPCLPPSISFKYSEK